MVIRWLYHCQNFGKKWNIVFFFFLVYKEILGWEGEKWPDLRHVWEAKESGCPGERWESQCAFREFWLKEAFIFTCTITDTRRKIVFLDSERLWITFSAGRFSNNTNIRAMISGLKTRRLISNPRFQLHITKLQRTDRVSHMKKGNRIKVKGHGTVPEPNPNENTQIDLLANKQLDSMMKEAEQI